MDESETIPSFSKYLNSLAAGAEGSLSADLALDLVLNEIVERACLATNATAGAIALGQNGEMVCRATTGENAPSLGVRFETSHGLSGACVRTRSWQQCNDTENDPRVDASVCRRLGVRSILVVPVPTAGQIIGVIETLSTRNDAFSDREVRCLESFAQEVAENVERTVAQQLSPTSPREVRRPDSFAQEVAENVEPPVAQQPSPTSPGEVRRPERFAQEVAENVEPVVAQQPCSSTTVALPTPETPIFAAEVEYARHGRGKPRDLSSTALLVCVVLLALILGWMTGRTESPRHKSKSVPASGHALQTTSEAVSSGQLPSSSIQPQQPPQKMRVVPHPKTTVANTPRNDGLIVTQNGKVVFPTLAQK
jgi:putative methionine-R-sulfoxide reductase with GAF domain